MGFKNFLLKIVVNLLKGKTNEEASRFLIVSTTGLGDTLWATPAIKALKEKYPEAYIAVLTSGLGSQVLERNPYINEIFAVKSFLSFLKQFHLLKKKQFYKIFIFHTSQRPILPFCALLGAKEIIGTGGLQKGLDDLLTKKLPQKYQHEVERRLDIVGIKEENPALEFFIEPKEIPQLASLKGILIGLHPGAKDKFKQWDPACFIALGNLLVKTLGCTIVVTGGKEEKPLTDYIASQIRGALSFGGKLTLSETAELLSKLSAFIANDTGPMHLAFAMHTPTLALFTPTDHNLCGPLKGANALVIQKHKTCSPCLRKKCSEPFCLLQISPKEALLATLKLIKPKEKN